jgi:ABC-type sugar transport system ATPase subunit
VEKSELRVPAPSFSLPSSFRLGIRPEDVTPDPDGPFAGRVALTEPLGVETIIHIDIGQRRLLSLVPGMTPLRMGETIQFSMAPEHLHFFDADGDRIEEGS